MVDADSVEIYDLNGNRQGLEIFTDGMAAVFTLADRIIIADVNSVEIYDPFRVRLGLAINTNSFAIITAAGISARQPRLIVTDWAIAPPFCQVSFYDLNRNPIGLPIACDGLPEVRAAGQRVVVVDDDSVELYDLNRQRRGLEIFTNGRADIRWRDGRLIVIDDATVAFYTPDRTRLGLEIFTNGRAFIPDLAQIGDVPSLAHSLNAAGQVAVQRESQGGGFFVETQRAGQWQGGVFTDIGTAAGQHAIAYAVNEQGQMAGYTTPETGSQHAFIWQPGNLTDLNSLFSGPSAWTELSVAHDLNQVGQVIGWGRIHDETHAFRLTFRPIMQVSLALVVR